MHFFSHQTLVLSVRYVPGSRSLQASSFLWLWSPPKKCLFQVVVVTFLHCVQLGHINLMKLFLVIAVVYCTVSFYKMKTTKAHVLCNIIINFQNQKSLFFLSCWGDIYLCLSVRLCEKQQYFGMSTMFGGFFF